MAQTLTSDPYKPGLLKTRISVELFLASVHYLQQLLSLQRKEEDEVIATATRCVGSLPSLCSPLGGLNILPSVLWLVTGVLKEAASDQSELASVAASPPQVAARQALKVSAISTHQ